MRPKQVLAYCMKVCKNHDKNLLSCKSEPISVKFLFSNVINHSTIGQNLLELQDFMILLRSNGNQAFKRCFHMITLTLSWNRMIQAGSGLL